MKLLQLDLIDVDRTSLERIDRQRIGNATFHAVPLINTRRWSNGGPLGSRQGFG
jgi:hypothetical protein